MIAVSNKYKRNEEIVALHDSGMNFREVAKKMKMKSSATAHSIYWREKIRAGVRRGIPISMRRKFHYLLRAKA